MQHSSSGANVPVQVKCPLCGGTSFTWGVARAVGDVLEFVSGQSFWQRLKNLKGQKIKARVCETCGNVQLFLKG